MEMIKYIENARTAGVLNLNARVKVSHLPLFVEFKIFVVEAELWVQCVKISNDMIFWNCLLLKRLVLR
jgi:hypothetical protein